MRVLMHVKDGAKTGKQKFLNRLAEELPDHGVEVVTDPEKKHDVYLAAKDFKFKTKKPKVLRMNGCYHDLDKPYKRMNEELAVQCRKADGIIYQSQFCLDMHRKYVGTYKNVTVVGNGAKRCERVLRTGPYYTGRTFAAVARWRPHKRLKAIRVGFEHANIPRAKLVVAGDGERFSDQDLAQLFNDSVASIHIASYDWAPNSVVEALVQGCPVITNNVGGTHEMVREGCGIVVPLDEPYDMRPVNLYKPPPIDHALFADALMSALMLPRVSKEASWHVNIENIAAQYKEFLCSVI